MRIYFLSISLFFSMVVGAQPTWSVQVSGTGQYLYDIEFIDQSIGYAVGDAGVILKTTDGGANWISQNSGTTNTIKDCFFYSSTLGWACTSDGKVLKTTNGGSTWSSVTIGTPYEFHQINFIATLGGIVAGKNTSTGYACAFYCTDGGTTWTPLDVPSGMTDILDIEFTSSTSGFVLDNYGVYYTEDVGATWYVANVPATEALHRINMYDTYHGWICGVNGNVFYTSDGGNNWVPQTTPTSNDLYGISIVDLNHVYICGNDGTVISTYDGGVSWIDHNTPVGYTLPAIWAPNPSIAYACGELGTILKLDAPKDILVESYLGPTAACPDLSFYVGVNIKNLGTTSAQPGTFEISDGSTSLLTVPYSGGLAPNTSVSLNLGQIQVANATTITISYSGDEVTTNNSINQVISIYSDQPYGTDGTIHACAGESLQISAYGGTSYYWLNASADSTAQTQTVQVFSNATFVVEIAQNTCVQKDTVYVLVTSGDCVTTAFSPNGDSVNDFFHISNLPTGNNTVTIFNRWGDEIISFSNYDNSTVQWDGSDYGGKQLDEGVYYYVVATESNGALMDGWVQIIR